MLTLKPTGQFRKDYKLAKRRGLDIPLLEAVIGLLLEEKPLEEKRWQEDMLVFANATYSRIGCLFTA